jgi:beta-glucanase (GH16 family)
VTSVIRPVVATLTAGLALSLAVPLGLGDSSGSSAHAAVKQSGTTSLTPPIVQAGKRPAAADNASLAGTVQFRPAKKGRPVVIQRRLDGTKKWTKVSTGRQNKKGLVSFTGPAGSGGSSYSYRGVAKKFKGLKPARSTPQSAAAWSTIFDDEFGGSALSDQWSIRAEGVYSPASQRACSASHPDAVAVSGGRVQLSVKADTARKGLLGENPCDRSKGNQYPRDNDNWYLNGHISTQDRFAFKYGVAAARVKFDREAGAHGSFWLQTTVRDRPDVGPAQDGAEIDVVEYFGKSFKKGDIYSFIHYKDAAGRDVKVPDKPITAARKALTKKDDWFKKYHVFSVEWTPKAYVFRVDGIQTLRLTKGVSRVPEFLILSMLSSDWELGDLNRSTLPNHTDVDWVRVWQQ